LPVYCRGEGTARRTPPDAVGLVGKKIVPAGSPYKIGGHAENLKKEKLGSKPLPKAIKLFPGSGPVKRGVDVIHIYRKREVSAAI